MFKKAPVFQEALKLRDVFANININEQGNTGIELNHGLMIYIAGNYFSA